MENLHLFFLINIFRKIILRYTIVSFNYFRWKYTLKCIPNTSRFQNSKNHASKVSSFSYCLLILRKSIYKLLTRSNIRMWWQRACRMEIFSFTSQNPLDIFVSWGFSLINTHKINCKRDRKKKHKFVKPFITGRCFKTRYVDLNQICFENENTKKY